MVLNVSRYWLTGWGIPVTFLMFLCCISSVFSQAVGIRNSQGSGGDIPDSPLYSKHEEKESLSKEEGRRMGNFGNDDSVVLPLVRKQVASDTATQHLREVYTMQIDHSLPVDTIVTVQSSGDTIVEIVSPLFRIRYVRKSESAR